MVILQREGWRKARSNTEVKARSRKQVGNGSSGGSREF